GAPAAALPFLGSVTAVAPCLRSLPHALALRFVRRPALAGIIAGMLLVINTFVMFSRLDILHLERNFFGIIRVDRDAKTHVHTLIHGSTEHGSQLMHEDRNVRRLPLMYFFPTGPIGQVFMGRMGSANPAPVAVIGLGAGSLATYAEPGQEFTFYEIDPAIERIAKNPDYFTFLEESRTRPKVVLGDARLSLARAPGTEKHYGLIVIDAFSSD